ncbi:uncharacterized protein LOC135579320 isoform X3 [Columba livia]
MLAMSASYKGPKVFQNNWDEVTKFEDSIQIPCMCASGTQALWPPVYCTTYLHARSREDHFENELLDGCRSNDRSDLELSTLLTEKHIRSDVPMGQLLALWTDTQGSPTCKDDFFHCACLLPVVCCSMQHWKEHWKLENHSDRQIRIS